MDFLTVIFGILIIWMFFLSFCSESLISFIIIVSFGLKILWFGQPPISFPTPPKKEKLNISIQYVASNCAKDCAFKTMLFALWFDADLRFSILPTSSRLHRLQCEEWEKKFNDFSNLIFPINELTVTLLGVIRNFYQITKRLPRLGSPQI